MKVLVLITLSLACVYSSHGYKCAENACQTVRCAAVTAENCDGKIQEKGGYCGCCDSCVKMIGPGEDCALSNLVGVPKTSECQDGYYCQRDSLTCQPIIF